VLGKVAADVVSVLNPTTIVVGGTLSRAGDHLLAGVKEMIYRRSLPLALDGLGVFRARSDDRAGILGAAHLVIDAALAPGALANTMERLAQAAKRRHRARRFHLRHRGRHDLPDARPAHVREAGQMASEEAEGGHEAWQRVQWMRAANFNIEENELNRILYF
jgi:hypothetical protein